MSASPPEIFPQDHRHLDNLIWQVPAWSTALFSLAVTAAVIALANHKGIGEIAKDLDIRLTVSLFLAIAFLILLLMAVAFMKFRLHQATVYRPNRVVLPKRWFFPSGHGCLLFILLIEVSAMLDFSMVMSRWVPPNAALIVSSIFLVGTFALFEHAYKGIREEVEKTLHPPQAAG